MVLNPRDCAKIRKEIDSWRAEALIGDDLTQKLLERYSAAGVAGSGHIGALITMGSVLIGVGVLLFVASNWGALASAVKLAIIVVAMLAFHTLGWVLGFEPGKHPRVGAGMMLVGSLIFGASIWLVAQMFNLPIDLSQGIIWWAVGVGGVAVATKSSGQSVLFSLLAIGWAVFNETLWHDSSDSTLTLTIRLLVAFGVATLLSYYTRSKSGIAVASAAATLGYAAMCIFQPAQFTLIPWGVSLFAFYLVMKKEWEGAAAVFMYTGSVGILGGLLFSTFGHDHWPFTIPPATLVLAVPAIVLSALAAVVRPQFRREAFGLAAIMALPLVALLSPNEAFYRLVMNLVLVATLVAAMWSAQGRLRQPGLINLAIAAFVIEVICRYFDFFFSMLDRSLAFTLGGIILVMAGAAAERGRRKLLQGMQS